MLVHALRRVTVRRSVGDCLIDAGRGRAFHAGMAKKSPAKRPAATASGAYDKPALRERLKTKIQKGTKGGRAGQWSARKAQLLAQEYEAAGGGYTGPRRDSQKHLKKWTDEQWHTRDGKPAARGKTTARYLPKKAWSTLSEGEKKATDTKKRKASRTGKQFVANTKRAKLAGAKARSSRGRKA